MTKYDLEYFNNFMVEYKEYIIAEYEKQLQKKDKEIERLKEELKREQDNSIYLEERINKAIENIENLQEKWNKESVPERNIYMFQTYLEGIDGLVNLKDILQGSDKE